MNILEEVPLTRLSFSWYLAEAGSLVFEVRSHFRWYYEKAEGVLVRGERLRRAA